MPKILGILGGMGPLASADFLRTVCDLNLGKSLDKRIIDPLVIAARDLKILLGS